MYESNYTYETNFEQDYGRGPDSGRTLQYTNEQLAEMEKSEEKVDPLAGIPTFHEFTQNTSIHGVRRIFDGHLKLRRLVWFFCVVAATAVFIVQVGNRMGVYFQYNTIVEVNMKYAAEIPFPAVTLCNQNNFRTSVAEANDLYYFIDEVYGTQNVSTVNVSQYNLQHVDTLSFLQTAAHQLDDFIDVCTYKGEPCNITEDFVRTLTDLGVCYTFNSGQNKEPLVVTESGTAFGLSMILNVEQYEYMRGPQNDAGIKIHLHDQNEFALMKDMGFAVAPGTHTLVGVARSELKSMQPPYGECNASNPLPLSNCQIECRTRMLVDSCGCRDIYMDNLTTPSDLCDMERQFVCIGEETVAIMKRQSECGCKVQCQQVTYEPSLSYAQLSKFNIDRMVLNDPVRRAMVNDKFLHARELSQRINADVAAEDRAKLLDLQKKLDTFWEDIKVVGPAMETDASFAAHYNILSILDFGDDLWRSEVVVTSDRLKLLGNMYAPILTTEMTYIDKWLPSVIFNLMELANPPVSGATPGLATKIGSCLQSFTFPLPEYNGDVKDYFRDNSRRRRKRSHVEIHPGLITFYAVDAAEYEKLHDLADCSDYLSLKQDFAEALVEHRENLEADRVHLQTIHQTFNEFFAFTYRNTSKQPSDMPKYEMCKAVLEHINETFWDDVDAMTAALETFVAVDDTADVMPALNALLAVVSTTNLVEDAAYTIRGKLYLNCYWVYLELISQDDLGTDYVLFDEYYVGMTNAYLSYPPSRVSFLNLGDFAGSLYYTMKEKIMPALSTIDQYLNNEITKMDLAQVFDSLVLKKAMQDLIAYAEDFVSISREFDMRINSIIRSITSAYRTLFQSTLPIVDTDTLYNFGVVKHGLLSGLPQHKPTLAAFKHNTDWGSLYETYAERILSDYTSTVDILKSRLPMEIDELDKSFAIVQKDFLTYLEENEMNEEFFMENFVQVDVFFKEMVYETITVQEAFGYLSLLGEVGGFMGLLLGASVMTICETMDFLVLMVYKKILQRATEDPGKDATVIMNAG